MTTEPSYRNGSVYISIGVLAWNEEEAISPALESLFQQSIFAELAERNLRCEVLCVPNGCTDQTAQVAIEVFSRQSAKHPFRQFFCCEVRDLRERGKNNAWNRFVHDLSSKEAEVLLLMDGDIVLQHPDTLRNMVLALEQNERASVATDTPIKDIALKSRRNLRDGMSLSASRLTHTATAQVTGQLYAIRARVARNIYLPRDLVACEDGFIKWLVCTCGLTQEASGDRVIEAENASHIFQAYTSFTDILRNQKRQIIGQTIVHILIDQHLRTLPIEQRHNLGETLRAKDAGDPPWLKRLIAAHLQRTRWFWRLFPNLVSNRVAEWRRIKGIRKLVYLPATLARLAFTLVAAWMARRFLVSGSTDYWPDTRSPRLKTFTSLEQQSKVAQT